MNALIKAVAVMFASRSGKTYVNRIGSTSSLNVLVCSTAYNYNACIYAYMYHVYLMSQG